MPKNKQIANSLIITVPDYQALVVENDKLRSRIKELERDKEALSTLLVKHEATIDELQAENKRLAKRIADLEQENKELKAIVMSQQQWIANQELKEIRQKFIKVIQDINTAEQLEINSDKYIAEILRDLRNERNGMSHFITTNDPMKEKKYKFIYDQLVEMYKDSNTYRVINDEYNGLLDYIYEWLGDYNMVPFDQNDVKKLNRLWTRL